MILNRGFTLMEIMVVLAVIGVISTVIFAGFGDARQDAKNRALMSELREMQLALEVYKAQNGQYPPTAVTAGPCFSSSGGANIVESKDVNGCRDHQLQYITTLIPDFVATLPYYSDSGNSNCVIQYQVDNTNFSWYKLTAINCYAGADSAAEGIGFNSEFARCPDTCGTCAGSGGSYQNNANFYESMSVYSATAECR